MSLENKNKTINVSANSVIDGVTVAQFYASINTDDLSSVIPGRSILDKDAYKANRTAVMADQTTFENELYAFMDEMTKEGE